MSHAADSVLPELSESAIASSRVLVVDDESMVTESLRTFLSIELDIDAVAFNDPAVALEYLASHEVDLVISDFLMPRMDGIRFLVEVKRQHPGVPRVLLTGYADKKNAITAINEVKLFQYIQKPWDNEHLRDVVLRALRHLFLIRCLATTFDEVAAQREDFQGMHQLLLRAFA
jgi:DNA-binding NtrC family response regulator